MAVRVGSCLLFGGGLALAGCIPMRGLVLLLVLLLILMLSLSLLQFPHCVLLLRRPPLQPRPKSILDLKPVLAAAAPFVVVVPVPILIVIWLRLNHLLRLNCVLDLDSDLYPRAKESSPPSPQRGH